MATVFEYIIITQTGCDYRAEGTSHSDAVMSFIDRPLTHTGYVKGHYSPVGGEKFIVVGPTQEHPRKIEAVTLVAQEVRAFTFKTPEQISREIRTRQEVVKALDEIKDRPVEIKVFRVRQDPIDDLLKGQIEEIRPEGVRINGITVPWCDIEGIEPLNPEERRRLAEAA